MMYFWGKYGKGVFNEMLISIKQSLDKLQEAGMVQGTIEKTADDFNVQVFNKGTNQYEPIDDYLEDMDELIKNEQLNQFLDNHKPQPYPFKINYDEDQRSFDIQSFIEVRGKSDFSMMDSMAQIPAITAKADVAAGLEDHGVGYGLYNFTTKMLGANKKPILGAELYLKDNPVNLEYSHLVVIAKNLDGYRDLSKLISLAASRLTVADDKNPKARPYNYLADFDTVNCDNLICLHGYFNSVINTALLNHDNDIAADYLKKLKTIFGSDDTYLEIEFHDDDNELDVNDALFDLAEKTDTKLIYTNDYHMIGRNDLDSLEVLQAIGMKQQVGHNNWHLTGTNWHFHTNQEVEELIQHRPDLIELTDNTIEIFNKCEWYSLYVKENYMPEFKLPQGFKTQNEYFEFLAHKGLSVRLNGDIPEKYSKQLEHEINIIEQMGFAGYFLIVADFINYAKRNYKAYDEETGNRWRDFIKRKGFDEAPIAIGPARGSAAGSLVAYSMYITEVDPMPYDLLFERFLNPERVSMPDIDTDIPDNKRAEIIEYVQDYYNGPECDPMDSKVAGIAVFGTMKIKGGIKAVVRGLYQNPRYGAYLASAVPDTVETKEDLNELINDNYLPDGVPGSKQTFDVAKILTYVRDLLGCATNLSQHAAGYVIAPSAVINYLPTTFALSNKTGKMEMLTSYTGVEANGLLKMDFLGLKAMTIINDAINDINNQEKTDVKFEDILRKAPYDNNLYIALKNGHTGDVFQLASQGMTDVIEKCLADVDDSPESIKRAQDGVYFDRLIAGIAMYRPGPKQFIPQFVENALHPDKIKYSVPEMKDVLDSSFGLLIYQESIMALLRQIAGFTLGGADVARRIMGHKKPEELPALKNMYLNGNGKKPGEDGYIPGGLALGHSEDELNDLWDDIEKFASYGFNKSHATGYAHISIVMTYLAYYYPSYFGVSNLNHAADTDEIMDFIRIYKKRGIKVLPPSVNKSADQFTAYEHQILFGLTGIKSVATKADAIFNERQVNGQFTSLYQFLARMGRNQRQKSLNKSSLEGLIYAGALDDFKGSRKSKINAVKTMAELLSLLKKEPHLIFDDATEDYFNKFLNLQNDEFDLEKKLRYEHNYTGFYISGHPADIFRQTFNMINGMNITDLKQLPENQEFKVMGVVTNIHKHITKTNETMAFVTIEDELDSIDIIVFPDVYRNFGRFFKEGNCLFIEGYTDKIGDHGMPYIVTSVSSATEKIPARSIDWYQLDLPKLDKKYSAMLDKLFKISHLNDIGENVPLKIFVKEIKQKDGGTTSRLYSTRNGVPMEISFDADTIGKFQQIFGRRNIRTIFKLDVDEKSSTKPATIEGVD